MAEQDNKPSAARDETWLELLQLHRKAVHQGDSDISDLFERRLREYREQLLGGAHQDGPLTPDAILDYAGMHGLISPRRQQWQWSQVFNRKLLGFARTVLAAAARSTNPAAPAPASTPPFTGHWRGGNGVISCGTLRVFSENFDTNPADNIRAEIVKWVCDTLNAAQRTPAVPAARESVAEPAAQAHRLTNEKLGTQTSPQYWIHELRIMARTRRAVSAHIKSDPAGYDDGPLDIADGALQDACAFESAADMIERLSALPSAAQPSEDGLSAAARDVVAERRRHMEGEDWTPEHDDEHQLGEMAQAAAAYAAAAALDGPGRAVLDEFGETGTPARIKAMWPWDWKWWKPKNRRQDLVRSGALILAELERIDRAAMREQVKP